MAAVSGQYGSVQFGASSIHECTKWTLNRKASIKKYNSCATGGKKGAVAGVREASGTIEGIYDVASKIEDSFQEGDSVTLKLYTSVTKFYQVNAVIASLDLEVDVEEGEIVRFKCDYEVNGAVTLPT